MCDKCDKCDKQPVSFGWASFFCKGDSQAEQGEVRYEQYICEKTRGEKMEKNKQEKSQEIFDEVITGMKEWRASQPKATMREIEVEARNRVSRLEACLIVESALEGQAKEWAGKEPEERPRCATCGDPLVARGKQKRRMQATMGREVELERTYGTCPKCGTGFFPPR